jgi:hypothetical protein
MKRFAVLAGIVLGTLTSLTVGAVPASAATVDGTCVANVTLDFVPPDTQPLPPNAGPATTSTGTGTISTCVLPGGGASTGTFSYILTGNLTCTTAQNAVVAAAITNSAPAPSTDFRILDLDMTNPLAWNPPWSPLQIRTHETTKGSTPH